MIFKRDACAIYAGTSSMVVATQFNEGRSHGAGLKKVAVDPTVDAYRQLVRLVNSTCRDHGRAVIIDNESDPVIGTIERFQGPGFVQPDLLRGHSLAYVEGHSEHQALAAWIRHTSIEPQQFADGTSFDPGSEFWLLQLAEADGKIQPSVCTVKGDGKVAMMSSHRPKVYDVALLSSPSIGGITFDYAQRRWPDLNFAIYVDIRTPALYERAIRETRVAFEGITRPIGFYNEPNAIPRGGLVLAEALTISR